MNRAQIRQRARTFARARDELAISDEEVNELVEQAGLDFSEVTRGIWKEINIPLSTNTRKVSLPAGFYRTEAAYYMRSTSSYLSDALVERDLADLLDPTNDYYSDGYPQAFAVTKDDTSPTLYLDTTPGEGSLQLYYRGRVTWNTDPIADASEPTLLDEFHIALAYRAAAYIAEIIDDAQKQASNLTLFEKKANAYTTLISSRAGSTGVRPRGYGKIRSRWGLTHRFPDGGSEPETPLDPSDPVTPPTPIMYRLALSAGAMPTDAEVLLASEQSAINIPLDQWPDGTRRYISYLQPVSEGDFTHAYYYATGHRNMTNVLGSSFTQQPATLTVAGIEHNWIRTRAAVPKPASARTLEAG